MIRSPVVVIGDKALNAALAVVCPVPPFAIAIVVPVHVPDVIVPTLVRLDVTIADGNAVPAKFAAGNPVVLVKVPDDGVPNAPPFTKNAPAEPVLTANAVATPVPNPDTPVAMGNPVALVNVTLVGVPNIGVTNVGEVLNTTLPVPVEVVTPVPPLAMGNVPVT